MTGPWARQAALYRKLATVKQLVTLDVRYGQGPLQTMDIFAAQTPAANSPLAIFFPGGGWMKFGIKDFSHVARGLNAHGVKVAVCGYDLAPAKTLTQIVAQCRAACLYLSGENNWKRLTVIGHSAGAHLAACMVATNWPAQNASAPANMTPVGVGLSGVYDVTEVLDNALVVNTLSLTAQEAESMSPIRWSVASRRIFDAFVGGDEPMETQEAAHDLAATWAAEGAITRSIIVPGLIHRTIVDELANPKSTITRKAARRAIRAAA